MLYCWWPPLPVIGTLFVQTAVQYALQIYKAIVRVQSVSASVRVIRNRETLFRTAMDRACLCVLCIAAPFGRTLCPLPRERVRLALDGLLLSGRPSPVPHYRDRYFWWLFYWVRYASSPERTRVSFLKRLSKLL